VSRQSKAALAAVVGILIGLGTLAGVIYILRESEVNGSAEPPPFTGLTDIGDTGLVTVVEPPSQAELTETIEVGRFPNALAAGEDSLWVMKEGTRVLRVNPETGRIMRRIEVGFSIGSERPCGIDAGEGTVWVTSFEGHVVRIDPATNEVTAVVDLLDPSCVAVGAGGVWVTSASNGTITRIDPETNEITDEIPVGSFPQGVAVGAGSVWVASSAPPDGVEGFVTRIDPETSEVLATIAVNRLPEYLAVGARGVWVTANDGTIRRISPRTNQLVGLPIGVSGGGRTVVTVGGGIVWASTILSADVTGEVVQIDPASYEVVGDPIPVGQGALGIEWGLGRLWVANSSDATVSKYTPPPS
jgi:YVTN family beta-propeller protein